MGFIFIKMQIANPEKPNKWIEIEGLIDTGAIYSVIPEKILNELEIKPIGVKEFTLANGEKITRRYGNALFKYEDKVVATPVIFGEEGDYTLIGTLTLEALGYVIDPFKRELRPMKMLLV